MCRRVVLRPMFSVPANVRFSRAVDVDDDKRDTKTENIQGKGGPAEIDQGYIAKYLQYLSSNPGEGGRGGDTVGKGAVLCAATYILWVSGQNRLLYTQ